VEHENASIWLQELAIRIPDFKLEGMTKTIETADIRQPNTSVGKSWEHVHSDAWIPFARGDVSKPV